MGLTLSMDSVLSELNDIFSNADNDRFNTFKKLHNILQTRSSFQGFYNPAVDPMPSNGDGIYKILGSGTDAIIGTYNFYDWVVVVDGVVTKVNQPNPPNSNGSTYQSFITNTAVSYSEYSSGSNNELISSRGVQKLIHNAGKLNGVWDPRTNRPFIQHNQGIGPRRLFVVANGSTDLGSGVEYYPAGSIVSYTNQLWTIE